MYQVIKYVIQSGAYALGDLLFQIDTFWVQGDLTQEQRLELIEAARENANPENSYDPLQKQVDALAERLAAVERRVAAIEKGEPEDPPVDPGEYLEYKQPSGAHDAYNTGDKVTFEGERYVCQMDGCVWSPKDYPQGWEKV